MTDLSANRLAAIIVSYNSEHYLVECLKSLYSETDETGFQVVVVDNASRDPAYLNAAAGMFPKLRLIRNADNIGFAKACNQGIRTCSADVYLLINPDCVVQNRATEKCLSYLAAHPRTGIVGCRVENPDGTLQLACRRTIPRPTSALYHLTGLTRLFPTSPRFARYFYGHVDPALTHEVEAVSGSYLMFRSAVAQQAGLLDEDFFLYGEDLDFCHRARLQGWQVIYYPGASVVHYKRRSSSQNAEESNYHFYNAMRIFYRKHYAFKAGRIQNATVLAAISCLYRLALIRNRLRGRNDVGSSG